MRLCLTVRFLVSVLWLAPVAWAVDFNRDVRPILAGKCFACHGPDEETREADLRLDLRDEAIDYGAIVPEDAEGSELIARVQSNDPDDRMPPPEGGPPLSEDQVRILREWILDGAKYSKHWAFVRPVAPVVPDVQAKHWLRNPIDHFVLRQLEQVGLKPSEEADRYTLVRRLYLDLIGLPPTPAQADAFVNNDDPTAYDSLVQKLLDSQRYGERWARPWLDLARYSDTNGYEKDRPRSIWPYRDWVIRALNDDMPFDEFTIHQLAGDMLPDATLDQKIATGFHRNTMLNEEGGIDPLEYRFYAMVDRVATTGTVWLGMTTGCAQCHSHKYDPITHTDYYQIMALLDNADEPDLIVPSAGESQKNAETEAKIRKLQEGLAAKFPPAKKLNVKEPDDNRTDAEQTDAEQTDPRPTEVQQARRQQNLASEMAAWIETKRTKAVDWIVARPDAMKSTLPHLQLLDDGSVLATGDATKRDVYTLSFRVQPSTTKPVTALRLEVLPDDRLPARGPGLAYYEGRKGDFFLSELSATIDGEQLSFKSGSASYGRLSVGSGKANAENVFDGEGSTGWSTAHREGESHQLVLNFSKPITRSGELVVQLLFERHFVAALGRFRIAFAGADDDAVASTVTKELAGVLRKDRDTWTDLEQQQVQLAFLMDTPLLEAERKPIESLIESLSKHTTTMVMHERPAENPRQTFRRHRGEYTSPREQVQPGLPSLFAESKVQPTNRLEFAKWLVSEENPLVARVTVNRAWRAMMGAGLMRTSGDFGTQSDPPTHGELLDWLADHFMERGWSMKDLHRTIVSSATYRQSSRSSPELQQRDSQNRWLARGPRFRVEAEMVRDVMLSASGLLSDKMYGPSVYPPQPESVTALAYGNTKWNVSDGEDRYRRSLYTFSKRTAPFASFTVFDGPTGETCLARRNRSNTPLQALTLLNDAMYVEMARALADRTIADASSHGDSQQTHADIATSLFRNLLTRPPTDQELASIEDYYVNQRQRFRDGQLSAGEILGITEVEGKIDEASESRAAWTMVARVLMNLDEAISRQ